MISLKTQRLALFITLICMWGAYVADASQNIRVVWSTSPQTEAVVVWDGDVIDKSVVLLYDTVSHSGKKNRMYAKQASLHEAGLYKESPKKKPKKEVENPKPEVPSPDLFYHQVPLKNLKPGTIYYLAVKTSDGIGREYHFKTAPADGKPFKLIYAGDSRSRIDVARKVSMQIGDMTAKDDSIIGLLHGGDYAGSPKRAGWKQWLEAYALTTTKDGKLLPIIPVVGNHETPSKSPMFRQA